MKVYNYGEKVLDTKIKLEFINESGIIDSEESIMLPYQDNHFLASIKALFDDAVLKVNPIWKEVDYQKSKCYFYITGDQIDLLLEVFPRAYTALEKQELLNKANKTIRDDGYSDYYEMLDRFDVIDKLMFASSSIGEMCFYQLIVDQDEEELLFSFCK